MQHLHFKAGKKTTIETFDGNRSEVIQSAIEAFRIPKSLRNEYHVR